MPYALADCPRPMRLGTQLHREDRQHALATMAPPGLTRAAALAWLGNHLFVVAHGGHLDRRVKRPMATLGGGDNDLLAMAQR